MRVCFALMALLPTLAVAAPPSFVKATFEMYRNNLLLGRVEETFTSSKGKYQIESDAKPEGLATLLGKHRLTRVSKGAVTAQGLKPEFYEEKQTSGQKEKIRSAHFDWGNSTITLNNNGKTETLALERGTQDWSSLFYQFFFRAPKKETMTATVADGRRVQSYHYQFVDETDVTTDAGKFETLHYSYAADNGERKTQFWLAKRKSFFPVKVIQEEDGTVVEQRLVALKFN